MSYFSCFLFPSKARRGGEAEGIQLSFITWLHEKHIASNAESGGNLSYYNLTSFGFGLGEGL